MDKFFLEILLALLACIIALIAFIWHGHMRQHDEINKVLKELTQVKPTCYNLFASKQDVALVQKEIHETSNSLSRLEGSILGPKNDK